MASSSKNDADDLRALLEKVVKDMSTREYKTKAQNEQSMALISMLMRMLKTKNQKRRSDAWAQIRKTFADFEQDILQDDRKKKVFKQRLAKLQYYADAFWVLANESTHANSGKHMAIDVRGDGSCFYQALHYSLMWVLPELSYFSSDPSLHKLKISILQGVFDSQDADMPQRFEKCCKDCGLDGAVSKEEAMEYLGVVSEKRSSRKEHAESLVTGMAALAFGVQILIYKQAEGPSPVAAGGAAAASFDDEACLAMATGNSTLDFTKNGELKAYYTGQPVVMLMYDWLSAAQAGHYYILGRFPLIEGVDSNGDGEMNTLVPTRTKFEIFKGGLGDPVCMPLLNMCMTCNRWMLPA